MSNYFGRKTIRIKHLPCDVGEILVREINRLLQFEKVAKVGNAVYIYIPTHLTNYVKKKVLEILNNARNPNSRKYTSSDLEIKSTIVAVTNIPAEVNDTELDNLLAGFGKTLTKFQFVKWRNAKNSMKLGWVVFEDLQSAEICEEKISNMRVNKVYLRACILPENIVSGQCFQELCTLHIEGFPSHFCNEDKIREVLAIIAPSSLMNLKYLQTSTLQSKQNRKSRYIALLDWNTPEDAYEAFVKLDGFQAADSSGKPLINLVVSFALPNTSAFGDYLQCMGRTTNARNEDSPDRHRKIDARLSTKYTPVGRNDASPCAAARSLSPPPPYVETESGLQRLPMSFAPPPYTLQAPDLTNPSPFPAVNNNRLPLLPTFPLPPPQNPCPLIPPMSALLNPQQLFQTLLMQGHQLTQQQFQQLGMQAAQQLARNTPISQQHTVQRFQPPPPVVTPRQTHIIQDGRPVVVQFSNHFPPLKKPTPNPVQTRQNIVRHHGNTNHNHNHQMHHQPPLNRNHQVRTSPGFVHTTSQTMFPTSQHHVVRRTDQNLIEPTSLARGRLSKADTGAVQTPMKYQNAANKMQGVKIGSCEQPRNAFMGNNNPSVLVQECRQNTAVQQTTEDEKEEKKNENATPTKKEQTEIPKTDGEMGKFVTPENQTPWATKRAARRWSTSKKVNPNCTTKWNAVIDKIVEKCESANSKNESRKERIADNRLITGRCPAANENRINQDGSNDVSQTNGCRIVSGEEKTHDEQKLNKQENQPNDEAPIQNETESVNILDALTRMSILDSINIQGQSMSSTKTLCNSYDADDEDDMSIDSRLLSFRNCNGAASTKGGTGNIWKPLPREMFNKLF